MTVTAVPSQHRVNRVLIPVAGRGARMYPATAAIPKELLPIGNRPLLEFALDGIADAGIEEVVPVTERGKGAIEDFVEHWNDRYAGLLEFAYALSRHEGAFGVPLTQRWIDCGNPTGFLEAQLCHTQARAPGGVAPVPLSRNSTRRSPSATLASMSPADDCA